MHAWGEAATEEKNYDEQTQCGEDSSPQHSKQDEPAEAIQTNRNAGRHIRKLHQQTSYMAIRNFCADELPKGTRVVLSTFASVAKASEKCSPSVDKDTEKDLAGNSQDSSTE